MMTWEAKMPDIAPEELEQLVTARGEQLKQYAALAEALVRALIQIRDIADKAIGQLRADLNRADLNSTADIAKYYTS
jgi:hypothetical protein